MSPLLDPYVAAVNADQDRELLQEASSALEAGAPRIAYVGIWIAIAESLRRRFVELAPRDHVAQRHLSQITARETEHKSVDGMLIRKAREYGLVTDAEATRLRHIYENRNVFGHPYEERPTPELVRAAASDGVEIVLGRETRLREGYLSEQVTRITQDAAFLDDVDAAIDEYAKGVHDRTADDLRFWFMRKLWRDLEPLYADASLDLIQRRGERFSGTFLRESPEMLDDWDAVTDLPTYPRVLSAVLAGPDLFARLSQHARDIVVGLLTEAASTQLKALRNLVVLTAEAALTERQRERVDEALESQSLPRLDAAGLPLDRLVIKIIAQLGSHNWYAQNPAARVLRDRSTAQLAELPEAKLEELGRNLAQAAVGDAGEVKSLLDAIWVGDEPWPTSLVTGIVLEFFVHESGDLRFKPRQMRRVVQTLGGVEEGIRASIVDRVVREIENGRPRIAWQFVEERSGICEELRELAANNGSLEELRRIAGALESVEVDPNELPPDWDD